MKFSVGAEIKIGVFFGLLLLLGVAGCTRDVGKLDAADRREPLMQRAMARQDEGKLDESIELYQRVVRTEPGVARAHLDLALLLDSHGKDYVGAIYHYREYLRLRPDTEKEELIRNRIRLAQQAYAAEVMGSVGGAKQVEELALLREANRALKDDNSRLKSEAAALERELQELRRQQQTTPLESSGEPEEGRVVPRAVPEPQREPAPSVAGNAAGLGDSKTYRVQKGDTLSGIAARVYKDPSMWRRIYDANLDVLGGSKRLRVGQVLVIP